MTAIQVDDSGTWRDIRYQEFEVKFGLSDVLVAPKSVVQSDARETIASGQDLRIRENGTTIFEGRTTSSGKRRGNGRRRVEVEHRAYELFEETVSFTDTNPTAQSVLSAALSASNLGGSFTLTFQAADVALTNDYEADGRTLKRVFRDVTDRLGAVWYVDGVANEITVDAYGARGVWASVNTQDDSARVLEFDPDNLETVVNDVTVNGTGGERVTGSASDSTSITQYGRRSKTLNVSYITTQSEADDYASALLQPDPLPEATAQLGRRVGNVFQNLANYEINITDPGTGLDETLVVEKQTVSQGSAEVELGKGEAVTIAEFNRSEKSKGDTTEPGSVYNSERIADGAIESEKLVDTAVIEEKIADLSITETKIQDDSISTPKLRAEAVTAGKILAGTITAAEIAAGTITANEINTLFLESNRVRIGTETNTDIRFAKVDGDTAIIPETDGAAQVGDDLNKFSNMFTVNLSTEALFAETGFLGDSADERIELKSLGPETALSPRNDGVCQLGDSGNNYSSVWAQQFISEGTVVAGDGGDPLAGLAAAVEPPADCRVCDGGGNTKGIDINSLTRELWRICTAQQRRIDDLENRVEDIEARLAALE